MRTQFCVARLSVLAVLLLIVVSSPLLAQRITGDITGTVTDQTGSAVVNANVRVENAATGEKASTNTNETGFYRLVGLRPGQYRLIVEAPGFKTTERAATVAIALVTAANFQLQVGAKGETVEVQGVAPLVETTETASAPCLWIAR